LKLERHSCLGADVLRDCFARTDDLDLALECLVDHLRIEAPHLLSRHLDLYGQSLESLHAERHGVETRGHERRDVVAVGLGDDLPPPLQSR
jgi:hypothetical protein